VILNALANRRVETEMIRGVDYVVSLGRVSEAVTNDDEWPALRAGIIAAEILIVATPTWLASI
jgi:multimeric flavodoxin WrbA